MPNVFRQQEAYLYGFTPDTYHVAAATAPAISPYLPGQLGNTFEWGGNTYTLVQLDSSATAPIAGQLLYWRNKSTFVVTNVVSRALLGGVTNAWRNEIAGICRTASAAAGEYICMLIQGTDIPCACLATNAVGDMAISDVSANVGYVLQIAVGTAPTYRTVGVFKTVSASNLANVDVAIPSLG